MNKSHYGSPLGMAGDIILPVNSEDVLFPFYWHTSSARGIHPDVNTALMVPDPRFGKVVAIEEQTTNMLPENHLLSVYGYYPNKDQSNAEDLGMVDGFRTVRIPMITADGTVRTEYTVAKAFPVVAGKTYTESVEFRTDGDQPGKMNISFFLTNIGHNILDAKVVPLQDGWYRASATFTMPEGVTTVRALDLMIPGDESLKLKNVSYMYLRKAKLEEGTLTEFTETTQKTGHVKYPKELLPPKDFTINFWISFNENVLGQNSYSRIISFGEDTGTAMLKLWRYNPTTDDVSNRRLIADFGSNASGSRQYTDLISTKKFVPGEWEMLTITFSAAENAFRFYRNGVFWTGNIITKLGIVEFVELKDSRAKYADLLICPRVVPDYEISTWFAYGKRMYDPYDYSIIYG